MSAPPPPASDHGFCNVVGQVLTFTTARSIQMINTGSEGYRVVVQLSAAEQRAFANFLKRVGENEVGIAVGPDPVVTTAFVGSPGGVVMLWFRKQRGAEQIFQALTGRG